MNKFKIKETYLLLLIVLGLISLAGYTTYALFTASTTLNDVVGITTTLDIGKSLTEYEVITVSPNETKLIELNIVNSYNGNIYYGAWYQLIQGNSDDLAIGIYTSKNPNSSSGVLSSNSNIKLLTGITNDSNTSIIVYLGVKGSLTSDLNLGDNKILLPNDFSEAILVTDEVLESHKTIIEEPVNNSYQKTGSVQNVTLNPGTYKLEVWGAQGGSYSTTYAGGKGGYSYGTLTLTEETDLFVYVGGEGTSTGTSTTGLVSGGFNGGGNGYSTSTTYLASAGGGASDIRIGQDSLYARVIVAGGGGGAASYSSTSTRKYSGGVGGGESGTAGGQYSTNYKGGLGGSQTSAGTSYYGTTANSTNTSYGTLASFGVGAGGASTNGVSGGGGGFYGGGYGRRAAAGGGSGYVYTSSTSSNYPSGALLTSKYYLTNAATIAGDQSFTDYDGTTVTGHSGDGYAKITGTSKVTAYTIPNLTGLTNITIKPGTNVDLTSDITLICENNTTTGCSITKVSITDTTTLSLGTYIVSYTVKGKDNKKYVFNRNLNIALDTSGANTPDLVQGLIPVMYDGSKWVKADETNSNETYKWYDYNNKLWANAVLVSDNGFDYTKTTKTVNISDVIKVGYVSSNKGVNSSTATSTLTITTGSNTGTLSFDYKVSSESNYDKLTITVNGTTIANAISGEKSSTYSVSATANTTYTIVATYTKDSSGASGDDTATIYNIVYPTGSTMSITNGDTYSFSETNIILNKIATSFTYDDTTKKYTLSNMSNSVISSDIIDKYICPDITQSTCNTMYKITEANTTITKVEEYSTAIKINRSTYQNASAGTIINEPDILAYYVWIPRYKYKVWNISKQVGDESTYAYNAYTEGIDIKFENEKETTGTISCTYNFNVDSANGGIDLSTTTAETCTGSNGDYYTHPAFTFGTDELRGFWISKFEMSSSDPTIDWTNEENDESILSDLTVRSLPNVKSWINIPIHYMNTVIQNMQISNNIYGLSTSRTNTDSHMLKNMEWGAVAYLTNSNYGRCTNGTCTEVTINNCENYITGIGGDTVSADSSSTTCTTDANKYNGEKGMLASTTGNITGVYDMSGGAYEYVMGNMSSESSGYIFYPSSSELASAWYTSNQKYLDTYAYYSSDEDNQTSYNRGRLGDATTEVVLSISMGKSGGWYGDSVFFPYYGDYYSELAWFVRGGHCYYNSRVGLFYFRGNDGFHAYDGAESMDSSHFALVSISN